MPKNLYLHKVIVQGKGTFPVDMLRYDGLYPNDTQSVMEIAKAKDPNFEFKLSNEVILVGWHEKGWEPTEARWASFLWNVLQHTIEV